MTPAFSWKTLLAIFNAAMTGGNLQKAASLFMGALTDFENGVSKFAELAKLFGVTTEAPAVAGPVALSTEEQEAKAQCWDILKHHGGIHGSALGDGKLAGRIGDFFKTNPWAWSLLLAGLKQVVPGLPV